MDKFDCPLEKLHLKFVLVIGGSAVCWVRTLPETKEIKLVATYGQFKKEVMIHVEG